MLFIFFQGGPGVPGGAGDTGRAGPDGGNGDPGPGGQPGTPGAIVSPFGNRLRIRNCHVNVV